MTGDQDFLVVGRVRGHQLVDDLEALPGQSQKRDDVRLGVSFVALVLLAVIRRIERTVLQGGQRGKIIAAILGSGLRCCVVLAQAMAD